MKWTLNDARFGDILRVKLGHIYHYGVYVDDNQVIQFGLPPTDLSRDPSTVEVLSTDIDTFSCGNFIEVMQAEKQEKKQLNSAQEIVKRAKERLGEKGYNILYNNCEHFVNECAFGKKMCTQVELLREKFRNQPFLNVYIKTFPFNVENNNIYPIKRQKEIDKCKSEKVKQEKFYAWKLLEYGLQNSLGLNINDIKFKQQGNKWVCPNCHFSISHTGNVVVVAVSRFECGVDIEKIDTERFSKFPPNKILTETEIQEYDSLSQNLRSNYVNRLWTVKEALFKQQNGKVFKPNLIDAVNCTKQTKEVQINGLKYYLSVVSNDLSLLKFNCNKQEIIIK